MPLEPKQARDAARVHAEGHAVDGAFVPAVRGGEDSEQVFDDNHVHGFTAPAPRIRAGIVGTTNPVVESPIEGRDARCAVPPCPLPYGRGSDRA